MSDKPIAAGKSSFDLVDPEKVFDELQLESGSVFLDVGCGIGNYALAAAEVIGPAGCIQAVDLWKEGIAILRERAEARVFDHVRAQVADVSSRIPVEDACVDVAFMATVLHDLAKDGTAEGALREIVRVLRPGGRLAVVEFDKVESEPGPPVAIRLSPGEVEEIVAPFGFREERVTAVGPAHYMVVFKRFGQSKAPA